MAAGGWNTSKEANHGPSLPWPTRIPIGRKSVVRLRVSMKDPSTRRFGYYFPSMARNAASSALRRGVKRID